MNEISIAIAQSASTMADIEANIAHHKKFVELAVENSAQMIIFPELSLTGYEPELGKDLIVTADDGRLITLKKWHEILVLP